MSSTLIAHSSKMKARRVSFEDLAAMPTPQSMGIKHNPVPHAMLVEGILEEIADRGFIPSKQQYAVSGNGQALFGVIDLAPVGTSGLVADSGQQGLSIGFRNSVNQSMAIKAVAGTRVFVCDNLALSGDLIALSRKNTTGLDLAEELKAGFAKFIVQAEVMAAQVQELTGHALSNDEAKVIIFDAFAAKFLPVRLMDDVANFYFKASEATPDCQPRTMWGLHNSFTRALKALSPISAFEANLALGKQFGLSSNKVN
jgi:hypothetical protein